MTTKNTNNSDMVWQVVQERIGLSGKVVAVRKLGLPKTIEKAKQIVEYKTTVESRDHIRYRIERADD